MRFTSENTCIGLQSSSLILSPVLNWWNMHSVNGASRTQMEVPGSYQKSYNGVVYYGAIGEYSKVTAQSPVAVCRLWQVVGWSRL